MFIFRTTPPKSNAISAKADPAPATPDRGPLFENFDCRHAMFTMLILFSTLTGKVCVKGHQLNYTAPGPRSPGSKISGSAIDQRFVERVLGGGCGVSEDVYLG